MNCSKAWELKTVLLVEDDELVRRTTTRILERDGYEVHAAETPAEAREACGLRHFDLVVADVRLPGTSGFELIRQLDEMGEEILPVVFTSGGEANTMPSDLANRGTFLAKPFSPSTLIEAVKLAIGESE